MIEVTVQVGSLAAFPYLKFDRETLDRTANVRVHIANVRTESVAPQVLGVVSLLQNADGNGFESMRNSAIQDALNVTPVEIVGNSVASYVHRYLVAQDPTQAAQELLSAMDLDPANPMLYVNSSILKQRQGLLDAARQDALTAQRIGPTGWAMPILLLANLAQDTTVIDLFTQVIQQRPDDWFPLFFRGAIFYQLADEMPGALDLARADLDAAIALNPEANFPYVYAALLAMHEGRLDDAQQAIRTILAEFPDPNYMTRLLRATFQGAVVNPYEVILSAFTNQTLGRYELVLEDTQRGLQVYTGMEDAYFLQGMAYCAQGDYAAAEQSFVAEAEIDSSFTLNTLMRADARLRLGDEIAAASDFDLITGGAQADVFAPYVEAVKAGSLGCANFFNPDLTPPPPTATATPTPEAGTEALKPGEHIVLVAQIEP
jgi:tetratricopeptide (TPR) repeat protein